MTGFIKALVAFGFVAFLVIFVVNPMLLGSGRGGEFSVVNAVNMLGTFAVLQILMAIGRSHHHVWKRTAPLLERSPAETTPRSPAVLRDWEALIVGASTDHGRSRTRLAARLEPLVGPDRAARLASSGRLTPDAVVTTVSQLLDETEESRA